MADEEERVLENLLELQLQEQRESLSTINEALASDPSNTELLAVHHLLLYGQNFLFGYRENPREKMLIMLGFTIHLVEYDFVIKSS